MWCSAGENTDLRTLISASSALGSAPPKLAQTVVVSAPTSAYQTSRVCAGLRTRSVVRVQWSVTSVRSGGSVTSSQVPTS
jgi:hypothetical protein